MLQYAVWAGAYSLVEELLAAGCSPFQSTQSGETAFSLALELKDEKMTSILQGFVQFQQPDTVSTVQVNNYMQQATYQARW